MATQRGTIVRGEVIRGSGHGHLAVCPRCGIERKVRRREDRKLCGDCRLVDPKFGETATR